MQISIILIIIVELFLSLSLCDTINQKIGRIQNVPISPLEEHIHAQRPDLLFSIGFLFLGLKRIASSL